MDDIPLGEGGDSHSGDKANKDAARGRAKAKADGRYKGRKPTARAKADDVLRLHSEGVGGTNIARALGLGRASVYRILDDAKAGAETA